MLVINQEIQIPLREIEFSFARSSGPGGQNVNKVSSKAILRWNPGQSPSLPAGVRARLLGHCQGRLTREGDLIVTSDRFRDQRRNREDCLQKLRDLIAAAALPPKPRKKTKPTRSSDRRRREGKKLNSEKKQGRSRVGRAA